MSTWLGRLTSSVPLPRTFPSHRPPVRLCCRSQNKETRGPSCSLVESHPYLSSAIDAFPLIEVLGRCTRTRKDSSPPFRPRPISVSAHDRRRDRLPHTPRPFNQTSRQTTLQDPAVSTLAQQLLFRPPPRSSLSPISFACPTTSNRPRSSSDVRQLGWLFPLAPCWYQSTPSANT